MLFIVTQEDHSAVKRFFINKMLMNNIILVTFINPQSSNL